ncbi:hypothetical protein KFE25_011270 [Diacronema lutheri]|uniref:Uncharacterized protein n=1 Tax=Diacronema lutheri TaxID=2081491 RepID=A0A8J6C4L1_DIALT|nr:hypothetical protein KFE25_011270 [Diacronema lutheri]
MAAIVLAALVALGAIRAPPVACQAPAVLWRPFAAAARAAAAPRAALCMRDGEARGGRGLTDASRRKFELLEAQSRREPTNRTAVLIVASGLIAGLGGALAFAAANGYLAAPTLMR